MHDHKVASNISAAERQARQDNKVRLSRDVLEKADRIAAEWGLKNARAAVEAVFRRYCDEYMRGCPPQVGEPFAVRESQPSSPSQVQLPQANRANSGPQCEALDALDQLLAL
ncbi:MAG: hypothetical protein WBG38_19625 [Nodosilinea sp.]